MSFMEPDVRQQTVWLLETNFGTETIPVDVCDAPDMTPEELENGGFLTRIQEAFKDYLPEGRDLVGADRKECWTYQLSASGYMDQTEYGTADTEAQAWEALLSMYASESGEPEDWERSAVERLIELAPERAEELRKYWASVLTPEDGDDDEQSLTWEEFEEQTGLSPLDVKRRLFPEGE